MGTALPRRSDGVTALLPLASVVSTQVGAALSLPLIADLGGRGTAALRLAWATAALLAYVRPRRVDWTLGRVVLGVVTAGMALCFFEAVARLPLATATSIEFVGPLGVAVAGSRRWRDCLWPVMAASGVVLLTREGDGGAASTVGVACALGAAAFWAAYIVLTRSLAGRGSALTTLTVSLTTATLAASLVGLGPVVGRLTLADLCWAAGVAVLFPLVPYVAEILALRHLPARLFGVLMCLDPVAAALVGTVMLGQRLTAAQVGGVLLISCASLGVVALQPSGDPTER